MRFPPIRSFLLASLILAGAIWPSSVHAAARFHVSQPAIIEGVGSTPQVFSAAGVEKECGEVNFKGGLLGSSSTLELEPIYAACTAKVLTEVPAKFVLNSCTYLLGGTKRLGGRGLWRAAVDIRCPQGRTIEWSDYEDAEMYSDGVAFCATRMPPQNEVGTATFEDLPRGRGAISIRWRLRNIDYRAYGSPLICGSLFGVAKQHASYEGSAIIEAHGQDGHRVDLSLAG